MTIGGITAAIVLNILQAGDLATKATKGDVQNAQQEIGREVKELSESIETKIPKLRSEIKELESQLLAVPEESKNRYSSLLKKQNAGIIKILPRGKYEEAMLMNGGGAYYSFIQKTHAYGHSSDIELTSGEFKVGFAGADYGFFLQLGDVAIHDIAESDHNPPSWLPQRLHEAWTHMWQYRPPAELAKIRLEQKAYSWNGVTKGDAKLSDQIPAVEGEAFLLRSLSIDASDVLVGAKVDKRLDDGALVLVYKILKVFETPTSIGPDLQD